MGQIKRSQKHKTEKFLQKHESTLVGAGFWWVGSSGLSGFGAKRELVLVFVFVFVFVFVKHESTLVGTGCWGVGSSGSGAKREPVGSS